MKFKSLLAISLAAASLQVFAQGYKDGVEYYKAGRVELAQELLEKNLANADTDKAASYYYLGLIELDSYFFDVSRQRTADANKKLSSALNYFTRGLEANAEDPFNFIGLGEVALIKGDVKAAEDNFKKAEKFAKKDAGVYAGIARAYYNVGKYLRNDAAIYSKQIDKALAQGEKLLYKRVTAAPGKADFQPNDPDFYILRGDMIFDTAGADAKLVGDACNAYEQAIAVDPTTGEAYVKYADTYYHIGKHDFAINKLRELLSKAPNSALGQRELAERLYADGQVPKAMQEYATLMRNPNHFASDEDRYLELLYFTKDYQKGFDQSVAFLAANPDQFSARNMNYVFAHELGRTDAVELADALLAAKKKTGKKMAYGIYPMMARDFNKAQRPEDAISVLRMGLKDYPDNLDMLKASASALAALDRYAEAADMLQDFVNKQDINDVSGTDLWTLSQYAVVAAQDATDPNVQGKYFEMSRQAAIKSQPKLAAQYKYLPRKRLGDIAQITGQDAVAAAEYMEALALLEDAAAVQSNAKDAMAMYRFAGIAAFNNKDMTTAKAMLTKYQQLNADDATVNDLLKKIK